PAQRGCADRHHRRLHGPRIDRGCRGGRDHLLLAPHWAPADRLRHQPRPCRPPAHPAADRRDHGARVSGRRPALRLARPAPARCSGPLRIEVMTTADVVHASPQPRGYLAFTGRIRRNVPFLVGFGIFWLSAMVLVALFADLIRPYDIT